MCQITCFEDGYISIFSRSLINNYQREGNISPSPFSRSLDSIFVCHIYTLAFKGQSKLLCVLDRELDERGKQTYKQILKKKKKMIEGMTECMIAFK